MLCCNTNHTDNYERFKQNVTKLTNSMISAATATKPKSKERKRKIFFP